MKTRFCTRQPAGRIDNPEVHRREGPFLEKNVPLGRLRDPDEIARAVSSLASDEASYMAGIELYVGGGIARSNARSNEEPAMEENVMQAL
jgi:NAD(P)-dependent dehydrogenase (short-subunit alcohol dehydrogenase family)